VQHVGEINENTELRMTLYPADGARAELYEDDGLSMAYQEGDYSVRRIEWSDSPTGARIVIDAPHEGRGPLRRARTMVALRTDRTPTAVSLAAGSVNQLDDRRWSAGESGWRSRASFVEIRLPPSTSSAEITIKW